MEMEIHGGTSGDRAAGLMTNPPRPTWAIWAGYSQPCTSGGRPHRRFLGGLEIQRVDTGSFSDAKPMVRRRCVDAGAGAPVPQGARIRVERLPDRRAPEPEPGEGRHHARRWEPHQLIANRGSRDHRGGRGLRGHRLHAPLEILRWKTQARATRTQKAIAGREIQSDRLEIRPPSLRKGARRRQCPGAMGSHR
jgi:hypothetical protein